MVFGLWGSSIWYWCADQNIVQRVLCAESEAAARWGAIMTALLKVVVFMCLAYSRCGCFNVLCVFLR